MEFQALGKQVSGPRRTLETFPTPDHVTQITLRSEEVTSLCPVTGQPDIETVTIDYEPAGQGIESKSLKLYLWSFRDEGIFCEALAARIADDVMEAARPRRCTVTVEQRPRGGISIRAVAVRTGE
ncbi:MAG TPA: preQ(1) synthase [Chloroflexota bacterium]|jgi:7-cyano-7-deazaguanine reductase|nr:preQ(1) synthase [Chloroflexota bacterium]